jgi:hypothetical protein
MEITVKELTKLWNQWVADSSLRSELRFGQYVCNAKLNKGYCWPEVYYASTNRAYEMLYRLASGAEPFLGRKAY